MTEGRVRGRNQTRSANRRLQNRHIAWLIGIQIDRSCKRNCCLREVQQRFRRNAKAGALDLDPEAIRKAKPHGERPTHQRDRPGVFLPGNDQRRWPCRRYPDGTPGKSSDHGVVPSPIDDAQNPPTVVQSGADCNPAGRWILQQRVFDQIGQRLLQTGPGERRNGGRHQQNVARIKHHRQRLETLQCAQLDLFGARFWAAPKGQDGIVGQGERMPAPHRGNAGWQPGNRTDCGAFRL